MYTVCLHSKGVLEKIKKSSFSFYFKQYVAIQGVSKAHGANIRALFYIKKKKKKPDKIIRAFFY